MMSRRTVYAALAAAGLSWGWMHAAEAADLEPHAPLPDGYELLYSQDFQADDAIGDFEFTFPDGWRIADKDGEKSLEFFGQHKYNPKVRSPKTIGLVSGRQFGDFILDVDLLQTGREYGHRDMCLFLGFSEKDRFYYCHMATKADPNAHNIFIVNEKPRTNIAKKTTEGIAWGNEEWHKVRLVRSVEKGTIEVFFDNMDEPIMVAEDKTHGAGNIGFGSFDDSGMIDNIRVYGKEMGTEDKTFFEKKKAE